MTENFICSILLRLAAVERVWPTLSVQRCMRQPHQMSLGLCNQDNALTEKNAHRASYRSCSLFDHSANIPRRQRAVGNSYAHRLQRVFHSRQQHGRRPDAAVLAGALGPDGRSRRLRGVMRNLQVRSGLRWSASRNPSRCASADGLARRIGSVRSVPPTCWSSEPLICPSKIIGLRTTP